MICVFYCCLLSLCYSHNRNSNGCIFLILRISACGLCPSNESLWICAKTEKVTNLCLSYWNKHTLNTLNTLMVWQPMKHTNNYNEWHLMTALAFYTKICMAEHHRDCMPFKKGQISIALPSHENTAVVLVFSLVKLF